MKNIIMLSALTGVLTLSGCTMMKNMVGMGDKDKSDMQMMSELLDNNTNHSTITVVYDLLHGILKL